MERYAQRGKVSDELNSSKLTRRRQEDRIGLPVKGHRLISVAPGLLDFHLLPTGARRISQGVTMTIHQDPTTSFNTSSSIAAIPARHLVLEIANEVYEVTRGGQEMIVINRTSSTAKPQRLKLFQSVKWSEKDRKRWELVHGVIERVKRHTERVRVIRSRIRACMLTTRFFVQTTWNLPSGCLHIMCNDPPDVVYHHHASPPCVNKAVTLAARTTSAAVTLSPSRGLLQLSIRRRWPAEQEANSTLGWTSKRTMELPEDASTAQSIRHLLDSQRRRGDSRRTTEDVQLKPERGEAGEEWDRDEVKALRVFLSLCLYWELALS